MFLCFFNGGRYSFFINTLNSVIFLECKCKKIIVKKGIISRNYLKYCRLKHFLDHIHLNKTYVQNSKILKIKYFI